MRRLAIIGAGDLGMQIYNLSLSNPKINVVGFIDDTIEVGTTLKYGNKIIGTTSEILSLFKSNTFDCLVIAIGYNHMIARKNIYDTYAHLIPFETIIHSSCIIDSSAKIGNGTILYPGCIIDENVYIENNVLLNLNTVIAHNSIIGSHCFLAPRVTLSGFVQVEECNFIGTGSIFKDNLKICSHNLFGAGSIVVENIVKQGIYYGNPSKRTT